MTNDLEKAIQDNIIPWTECIEENNFIRVYIDGFPVTSGHRLYVPLNNNLYSIWHAFYYAQQYGDMLVVRKEIDGYNIGINQGKAAGQTVMYPHVHFIPRRIGDCTDPVGGVRNVIPGQGNYHNKTYINPNK